MKRKLFPHFRNVETEEMLSNFPKITLQGKGKEKKVIHPDTRPSKVGCLHVPSIQPQSLYCK